MEIKRSGSQPSGKGPAEYFTGTVRIDPLFQATEPARAAGRQRHVRARRPHRLAYASARPDAHRHGRLRPGPALGRPDRGDPAGRRGLVSAGREALARGDADDGHDAHRHPGAARRQGRRVDGKGQRRAVRGGQRQLQPFPNRVGSFPKWEQGDRGVRRARSHPLCSLRSSNASSAFSSASRNVGFKVPS